MALLERNDWDFSGVPDFELIACCHWEYARESTFIRETLRLYRDHFHRGFHRDAKASDAIFARMDRIQSIGDLSEVIIGGCSFPPGLLWSLGRRSQRSAANPRTGTSRSADSGRRAQIEAQNRCRTRGAIQLR